MLKKMSFVTVMGGFVFMAALSLSVVSCGDEEDAEKDTEEGSGGDNCVGGTLDDSLEPPLCTIPGKIITDDVKWVSSVQYLLNGRVFIGDGKSATKLTIEAGTTIFGAAATDDTAALIIQKNATIDAVGTASDPIVFTSSKEVGDRAPGDWGGVVINGNAPINVCNTPGEACESEGEGETGIYGGDDADDNSGTLKYVRIEFSGKRLTEDSEFNGLALQGVGTKTTVEYIQIHRTSDDSLEFFGGTARVRHILLTGCGDDGFDWTQGWSGMAQYVIIEQADDIETDRGIEADNNGDNNDAAPRANPTLYNFTIIGAPNNANEDILGVMLREGTAGTLRNFVITGFDTCIDVDHDATWKQVNDGELSIDHSMVEADDCFKIDSDEEYLVKDDFWDRGANNIVGDPDLDGWAPNDGSPVLGIGAGGSGWIEDAGFIGAVGETDWTEGGWTAFPKN